MPRRARIAPCPQCGVPTRSTGQRAADHPGTRVRRGPRGLCSPCFYDTAEGASTRKVESANRRRERRARARAERAPEPPPPPPPPRPEPEPEPKPETKPYTRRDELAPVRAAAAAGNQDAVNLLRYFQEREPFRAQYRRDEETPSVDPSAA